MTEFKAGQLVVEDEGNGWISVGEFIDDESISYEDCRLPTEAEARELLPDVFSELDRLRLADKRLKEELLQISAEMKSIFIGEYEVVTHGFDEDGQEIVTSFSIPWHMCKKIYKEMLEYRLVEMARIGSHY